MRQRNELALFAGAGGGLLAGRGLSWRTIAAVEKEPYCREVLLRRQRDGLLPLFPIWDDIKTFNGRDFRGWVDVITAGFPCQPFSVAGKQQGEDDSRNMWPETIRVIKEVRPRHVFLENVPTLLTSYLGTVLRDLAESGYDARWTMLSAAGVGAPHVRERLWILADANELTNGKQHKHEKQERDRKNEVRSLWWEHKPDVSRVANGVANRMDRLKALGNGWVPQQAVAAYKLLNGE